METRAFCPKCGEPSAERLERRGDAVIFKCRSCGYEFGLTSPAPPKVSGKRYKMKGFG